MNSGSAGSFNRLSYDRCAYEKRQTESTGPFGYQMYAGKFENQQKCVLDDKNNWRPFDGAIVENESELRGISRRASSCAQFKYNPGCSKSSGFCTSTFDPSNPIVMPAEACPIVQNNLVRPTNPGYSVNVTPYDSPRFRYPNFR